MKIPPSAVLVYGVPFPDEQAVNDFHKALNKEEKKMKEEDTPNKATEYCSKCCREPDGCICGSPKRATTAHEPEFKITELQVLKRHLSELYRLATGKEEEGSIYYQFDVVRAALEEGKKLPDFKEIEAHELKRQLVGILKNLRGSKKMKKTDNMSVEDVLNLVMLESTRIVEYRTELNKTNYELAEARGEIENLAGNNINLTNNNEILEDHIHQIYVLLGGNDKRRLAPVHKYEAAKRAITNLKESLKMLTEYDPEVQTPDEKIKELADHVQELREYIRRLCTFAAGSANGTWKQQYESIREKMEDMERELKANSEEYDSLESDLGTVSDYLAGLYRIATGDIEENDLTDDDRYEAVKKTLDRLMRQNANLDVPGKRDTAMILAEQLDRSDKEVKRLKIELRNREEHIEKLTTAIGYAVDPSEKLEDLVAAAVEDAEETNKRENELEEYGHELHGYLDELYRMTTDDYEDLGMSDKAMFEAIQKHIKYYEDPGLKPTDDEEREKMVYLLECQVDKFRKEAMYLRNRLKEIHDIVLPDGDKGLPDDSIANVIISRVRYLMHPRNAAEWKRIADFRRTQLEVIFKKLLRTNPAGLSDDDLSQDIKKEINILKHPVVKIVESEKEIDLLQEELECRREQIERLCTALGFTVDPSEDLEDLVVAAVEEIEERVKHRPHVDPQPDNDSSLNTRGLCEKELERWMTSSLNKTIKLSVVRNKLSELLESVPRSQASVLERIIYFIEHGDE